MPFCYLSRRLIVHYLFSLSWVSMDRRAAALIEFRLMTSSRLMPERRRALELLAKSRNGVNEELLVHGHDFKRRMLAELVRGGLAAAEREVVMAWRQGDRGGPDQDHGRGAEGDGRRIACRRLPCCWLPRRGRS
jgi:hypothetical protein